MKMKRLALLALLVFAAPCLLLAQEKSSSSPVADALRQSLARFSKNMTAAAESMPADKYDYKPTPQQITYAHLIAHIATSNEFMCSKISGTPEPQHAKIADTDGKDKLVAAVRASFEYCSSSLAKVDDSNLSEQLTLFGNRQFTKAAAMMILSGDWFDHYSGQAMYLRLNGVLPPTAQAQKKPD